MCMLKLLERWPAILVQNHNLSVEDELPGPELAQRFDHGRKSRRQIIVVARDKRNSLTVANRQGAVSVQLEFVEPAITLRQVSHELGLHRLAPLRLGKWLVVESCFQCGEFPCLQV